MAMTCGKKDFKIKKDILLSSSNSPFYHPRKDYQQW